MYLDKNQILSVKGEEESSKNYTKQLEGFPFIEKNHKIIVLHKKNWKIIDRKEIGQGMKAILIKEKATKIQYKENYMLSSLSTYKGFNEETGETYFFIPQLKQKQAIYICEFFKYLTEKEFKITYKENFAKIETENIPYFDNLGYEKTNNRISFLFGLSIIYGNRIIKNQSLISIKIQIPILNNAHKLEKTIRETIQNLNQEKIYCQKSIITNKDYKTIQITINDRELLKIFTKFQKSFANIKEIAKHESAKTIEKSLIEEYNNKDIKVLIKGKITKPLEHS